MAGGSIAACIRLELDRLGPLDWSKLRGVEMTDCVICEQEEGTVMAPDGRLICEWCDGDRARGLA